jgi:8-oxo-dGTP diphosphatase
MSGQFELGEQRRGGVLLLRHASAGGRLSSPYIDHFRELDDDGRMDARQLVWTLAGRPLVRVVTSPLPRCVQSVVPIAESRRLVVERRDELLPDASVDDVMGLLVELPDASLVCTHREIILQLFAGEISCEKGGAWVLERVGALLSPLEYIAPPSTVPDPFRRLSSAR